MNPVVAALGPQGFGSYAVDWSTGVPSFTRSDDKPDGLLVPGFVDNHIHGAFGFDFMSASKSDIEQWCRLMGEQGYEAFLPTTVTAPLNDVLSALKNLPEDPMIQGFHLEGPFISPSHPGAQPPESILGAPNMSNEWDAVLNDPRLRVVTMAPETPGGLDLVKRLVGRGVVVSLGHTDATFEQAVGAAELGASQVTHTYNAMRGLHHREPGTVGAVLTLDALDAELIYDRHHVSKPATDVLFRCKGLSRVIAVSDSTAATGLPDGTRLTMWGHECVKRGDSVRLESNGALAGSAVTLLDCFRNLYDDFGPEAAIRASSLNPRAKLRMNDDPRTWIRLNEALQIEDIRRI